MAIPVTGVEDQVIKPTGWMKFDEKTKDEELKYLKQMNLEDLATVRIREDMLRGGGGGGTVRSNVSDENPVDLAAEDILMGGDARVKRRRRRRYKRPLRRSVRIKRRKRRPLSAVS